MIWLSGQPEWNLSDRLVDGAAPDALGADSSASHLPIFAYNFDTLKIHFELATGDARDLGTNTPQVLRFTTRFNRITDLGLLATNLTLAGHVEALSCSLKLNRISARVCSRNYPSRGWV